jgi:hypothetical protein
VLKLDENKPHNNYVTGFEIRGHLEQNNNCLCYHFEADNEQSLNQVSISFGYDGLFEDVHASTNIVYRPIAISIQ